MSNQHPLRLYFTGTIAVLAISFASIGIYQWLAGPNPHREPPAEEKRPSREELRARTEQAISKAEAAAMAAVSARAKQFHDFVAARQYRTVAPGKTAVAAFAADLLTLGSKGRLVWSKMPFTDKDGYRNHVNQLFSKYLFSPEELGAELKRTVDAAVNDVAAIENQLAVELEAIISGTPSTGGLTATANQQFKVAIAKVIAAGEWDVTKDVGNLVASEVAAGIATAVLVRMGIQAGVLTTSAGLGWWTAGASLVIGVLVDVAWGWIDNPQADIEQDVLRTTTKLAVDSMNALNVEFSNVVARRRQLWNLSANKLLP